MFTNELPLEVIENGRHGASITPDVIKLFVLLLADDIVLLSETPVGLQIQLNILHVATCTYQLKSSMKKSNIVVFGKGGYQRYMFFRWGNDACCKLLQIPWYICFHWP